MKYESNILKRLVEKYGVIGSPSYDSEIIKQFITQGQKDFPQLFTYQADWLNHIDKFGLSSGEYTMTYTGQSVYIPNTKGEPVKRAILKGSTKYRDIDTGEVLDAFEDGRNLELVSVKMPVLTTTGKNLFNKNKCLLGYTLDENGLTSKNNARFLSDYIPVKGNIILKCHSDNRYFKNIIAYDSNKKNPFKIHAGSLKEIKLTIPSGVSFIRFPIAPTNETETLTQQDIDNIIIQIEQGTQATSYEPYKSNILTVNEDVTLRGIGEVQDELDLLAGEVTQRIGEVVLDGSDSIEYQHQTTDENTLRFFIKCFGGYDTNTNISAPFLTDSNLPKKNSHSVDEESIFSSWGGLYIRIAKEKLTENSVKGFKLWLSQNPITIQYQLVTSIVKTVDLSIVDQDKQTVNKLSTFEGGTHISSGSDTLKPVFEVEVVEDLEKLILECSSTGNTM